jgi:NAD+ kinase
MNNTVSGSASPGTGRASRYVRKVVLVVKKAERAANVAESLRSWLEERGRVVELIEPQSLVDGSDSCSSIPDYSEGVDLVVVLGGDGTLLFAARTLGRRGVPLLGVNLGGLGFLTEINLENLYPTLEGVIKGDYPAEERMMLDVVVRRNGRSEARHAVLNDAVINKGALARIMNLRVKVDGKELTTYRADGLIISTPTGSTAYNLSAGGPIVHPAHETIILTPICPFTLTNRPLILPSQALVEAEVDPEASDVILTSDGQVSCPLEPGDWIAVKRSENRITLIKNPYKNYFEILRTKLGWG